MTAVGLAQLILLGLLADWLARQLKLPGLIGLLALGIVITASGWAIIPEETQGVSADWRLIALVVILLRAGLEMHADTLRKIGGRALLMACVPCAAEVAVVTLVAPMLLPISTLEAAVLGSVLAAVSPAVVVPLMVQFIEERRGADKGAPTLVLAGASGDDALAIVLCGAFVAMLVGDQEASLAQQLMSVPVSIIVGVIAGLLLGTLSSKFFERCNPRATKRVMLLLGLAILLYHFETFAQGWFASLVCIMAIGFMILRQSPHAAQELSQRLGKIWIFAQILLFTFVGMAVDISVAWTVGLLGVAVIACGLLGRSAGVLVSLAGSNFNRRERLFVVLSYLPKATVQAAIGSVPLLALQQAGMDDTAGHIILAMAVMSIIITAPLGALAIQYAGPRCLTGEAHPGNARLSSGP